MTTNETKPSLVHITENQASAFAILSNLKAVGPQVKAAKQTLSALFINKAIQFKDSPVTETEVAGKMVQAVPAFEAEMTACLMEGMRFAGVDITNKAALKAHKPTQWTQYLSDTKIAIARGVLADMVATGKAFGMYDLKMAKIAANNGERTKTDALFAAKQRYAKAVAVLSDLEKDSATHKALSASLAHILDRAAAEFEALVAKAKQDHPTHFAKPEGAGKADERTGTAGVGTVDTSNADSNAPTGREGIAGERNPEPPAADKVDPLAIVRDETTETTKPKRQRTKRAA